MPIFMKLTGCQKYVQYGISIHTVEKCVHVIFLSLTVCFDCGIVTLEITWGG